MKNVSPPCFSELSLTFHSIVLPDSILSIQREDGEISFISTYQLTEKRNIR